MPENAGTVGSESLAAESYRDGGGFADNAGAEPETLNSHKDSSKDSELSAADNSSSRQAATDATYSNSERYDNATGRSADSMGDSYGGTAPSYIAGQYHQDPNGPHGTNLTEGDWDASRGRDGLRKALESEPGSGNDPSRQAERDFKLKDSTAGPDTGPKQDGLDKGSGFDNLGSNVPA